MAATALRLPRSVRALLWATAVAAFATFCVVQDRVTAEGARRYVALQQDALSGRGSAVTIDEVMRPAVARSVRLGALWGGAVALAGASAAVLVSRLQRKERGERAR